MSFRTMHLAGMTISDIRIENDTAYIEISKATIIKNMDGAEEDTKWIGFGTLTVEELVICDDDNLPSFPCEVGSADLKDNQMTYRNETLIPIQCHGNVGITLQCQNSDQSMRFIGEKMHFDVAEHEKYVEHIKHQ